MSTKEKMPPAMILCGGKGTRLREVTELLPKPMVPIGGQPILWHIMKCYAAYGVRRFILCLGYKSEEIIDYFVNYHLRTCDATIKLGHGGEVKFHGDVEESDWEVTLANTGLETMTGGRVARAARYLKPGDKDFFLTYGDGVADIDFAAELAFHRAGGRLLTVAAVHPAGRFGAMKIRGGKVLGFEEKPSRVRDYVNGGFMVMEKAAVKRYLENREDCFLEAAPMSELAAAGKMDAYEHNGFWQCMDTPREHTLLNQMYDSGHAPWTAKWGQKNV